jgi:hypothetical protein
MTGVICSHLIILASLNWEMSCVCLTVCVTSDADVEIYDNHVDRRHAHKSGRNLRPVRCPLSVSPSISKIICVV